MKVILNIIILFLFIFFSKNTNAIEVKKEKKESFIQNSFFTYENDSVYGKDKYYTNGVQLLFLTRDTKTENENKILSTLFNIKNKSFHNYSFGIGQKIYTPGDIEATELLKNDRPYAGYLYTYLNKNIYHSNKIDAFGISIGLTGNSSLGKTVQTNVHDWIGSPIPQGWDNQLSNEFLFMLSWLRVVELHKAEPYTYNWKFMPKFSANIGTPFTNANIAMEFRYGWNLDDDLTQNRIKPLPLGIRKNDKNPSYKDISYYAFLEIGGDLILYDTFLNGNISGYRPDIDINRFRYEVNFGLALRLQNFYVKYSNIYASKEFKEQEDTQLIFSITVGYLF